MDIPSLLIAVVTLAVLFTAKKIPEPVLILLASFAGFFLFQGPR